MRDIISEFTTIQKIVLILFSALTAALAIYHYDKKEKERRDSEDE
jgi:uncharacterized membrane protein YidH (DUF202 family)